MSYPRSCIGSFFSSRRRHTRYWRDWSSDVCSSDLSSLTDVTYVFDEPTIGLHPHDIQRMNELLLQLRDKGNTVLVVEHKPETIAIADHVVDLGPGAGAGGGEVVFEGTVDALRASDTTTGRHFDDRASLKGSVRTASGALEVRGAATNNLQD